MPGYPGLFDILEGSATRSRRCAPTAPGSCRSRSIAALGRAAPVVYVQAGPQNPTGVVTPPARLRALAAVLDEHDAVVVEDATLAELVFAGRPPTDLARLCRRATVRLGRLVQQGAVGRAARRLDPRRDPRHRPHAAPPAGPRPRPGRRRRSCWPRPCCRTSTRSPPPAGGRSWRRTSARGAALLRAEIPEWHVPDPRRRVGAVGRTPGSATPTPSSRSPTATASTSRRDRSPSRGGGPTPTCGSASIGRGRSSRPACGGSGRRGATSRAAPARIAG